MEDLFDREQSIYDSSVLYLEELKNGAPYDIEKYEELISEYGKLLRQLRRIIRISDRTTEDLNDRRQNLLDLVQYDALTGIFNRRFLEEKMLQLFTESACIDDMWLSVLMIDIDYFKRFNDTYGHQEGDECLRKIAEALKTSLVGTDEFVARYGGEEFIVILPDTNEESAMCIAQKLLQNVRECGILHEKNSVAPYVTISVGVTSGTIKDFQSPEEGIRLADRAVYKSKQMGRNRYTFIGCSDPRDSSPLE